MDPYHFPLEEIPWDDPAPNGSRGATLAGSREEFFSYAYFLPAGVYDAPHSHPTPAHLVVARGTLRLGFGESFLRADTSEFPTGSFLFVPAGVVHFDGADEDTILIGASLGPWGTQEVPLPARKGDLGRPA